MIDEIIILFLTYKSKSEEDGVNQLKSIAARMFPLAKVTFITIDNAIITDSYFEEMRSSIRISGDNSQYEFSGWDCGISFINKELKISNNTMILFANDTFYRRNYKDGTNFLDIFDAPILEGKNISTSAVGYLDDFPKNVRINGIVYKSWIRSNIFILPISVVSAIYPLSIEFPLSEVFSDSIDKFWSDSDLISENWKAYISSWMFGVENKNFPEYKLHWLKAEPLCENNWEMFKKKALCILSEHYLSAKLHKLNVPIIDTNIFEKKINRHVSAYYA